jgi:hypothetical protein
MEWQQIPGYLLSTVLGGIIVWFFRSKMEELRALEERLREERRKIYMQLLEPYIKIFANPEGKGINEALRKFSSYEYRKTAFEFTLFGSDEVIQAYNNLMQHIYKSQEPGHQDTEETIRLWGKLLLEIRKSLGNKKTKLGEIDMFKGMIKDIEKIEKKQTNS